MKIFLDTCNIEEIKRAAETGRVCGVTTNPSLMKKACLRDYRKILEEICLIPEIKHVSAQVRENASAQEMAQEGFDLSRICPGKIVVKMPAPFGKNREVLRAIPLLKSKAIYPWWLKVNVTLIFSIRQATVVMGAGADFISPFLGRREGAIIQNARLGEFTQEYGKQETRTFLRDIVTVRNNCSFKTEVLAASARETRHIDEACILGADIVTVPPDVFWEYYDKPEEGDMGLTEAGRNQFLEDRKFLVK